MDHAYDALRGPYASQSPHAAHARARRRPGSLPWPPVLLGHVRCATVRTHLVDAPSIFSEVVRNMAVALRSFLGARPDIETIHLFGYSGGGVVAALLAAHFSNTKRLVTIAAPLDLDAWVHLHGFSPMEGSLNPLGTAASSGQRVTACTSRQLGRGCRRLLNQPFVDGQVNARFVEVRGFVHDCCW